MLYLASQSPRRRELLARLGLQFGILQLDVPEQRAAGEPADDYVRRVAREKAGAGLLQVSSNPRALVLGADTEVVLDDDVFGKPSNEADAAAMLRRLGGRSHRVVSALYVMSAGREVQRVSMSEVQFAPLDEATIARYLATGEWQGKAGAYAIQGVAEAFVSRLSGSYSGVMGLPLHETASALAEFGIEVPGHAFDASGSAA